MSPLRSFSRFIIVLPALLFILPVSTARDTDRINELHHEIREYLLAHQQNHTFSGNVFVRISGDLIYESGGSPSLDEERSFARDDIFRIGSLTKPVVASWFVYMHERENLSLDDPLSGWLPDYPGAEAITLKHLLSHTSGVPNFTAFDEYPRLMHLPVAPDDLIARFSGEQPEFDPGKRFSYSNSNYILLSRVMEIETGRPFGEAIDAFISDQLGINGMQYEHPDRDYPDMVEGFAYNDGLEPAAPIHMSVPLGAGGLTANGDALLAFIDRLYDEEFISESSMRLMTEPQSGNYALGLGVGPVLDQPSIGHTGGINGFASNMLHLPHRDISIVVLSNLETAQVGPIVRDLLSMVLEKPYTIPEVRREIRVDPETLSRYSGRYELAPDFELKIFIENNELMAQATGQQAVKLHAETRERFFIRVIDAVIEFHVEEDGSVERLTLNQSGQQFEAPRIE